MALAVGVLGLGAIWLWAPAAVVITFLAAFMSIGAALEFNTLSRRLLAAAASAVHGVAIFLASGSILLGAAAAVPLMLMPPGGFLVDRFGYKCGYVLPVLLLIGLGIFAAAWPTGAWGWAVAPALCVVAFFSVDVTRSVVKMNGLGKATWPLAQGELVPTFKCRARDGSEFDLEQERGRYVLLCFLRGDWCPVCQVMMRSYRRDAPLLARHGVKLVAVSPLSGPEAEGFAKDLGLDYAILVDEGARIARQFGAIHPKGDPMGQDTMLPASFLIDREGKLSASTRSDELSAVFGPQHVLQIERLAPAS